MSLRSKPLKSIALWANRQLLRQRRPARKSAMRLMILLRAVSLRSKPLESTASTGTNKNPFTAEDAKDAKKTRNSYVLTTDR
jgi:hypothetical protein